MTPISVEQLCKTYVTGLNARQTVRAVDNISFTVSDGQTYVLVGPNGAGKTSLIRLLLGLMRPDKGKITLYGENPGIPKARQRVAYVPETPALYPWASGDENILYFGRLKGLAAEAIRERSNHWLRRMHLDEPRQKNAVSTYSKGMRQKLALTIALIQNPGLLILDEPFSGLDPLSRRDIIDVLKELQGGGTSMFICSHILSDVQQLAHAVHLLNLGKTVDYWNPTQGGSLEDWYIGKLRT